MSALAKIQRDFCQFVLGHGHWNFMDHMKPSNIANEAMLDVYHNNVFSVHIRSLANDYPLVFSTLGVSSAHTMAQAYIEASIPCTGSLESWGGGLSSFIQNYELAASWPYLADLAQFEWAKHMAYCAPEEPLLTAEYMNQIIVPLKEEVTFRFQKSCQLLAFSYPLKQIISSIKQDHNQDHSQTPAPSYALILKHQGMIKVYWLTPSLFVFVNRLKEGQDVEVAFAAAQVLEPQFDAQEAFVFLLSNPILKE
jgi:hypothetical protein